MTAGVDGLYFSLLLTLGCVPVAIARDILQGRADTLRRSTIFLLAVGAQIVVSQSVSHPNFVSHTVKLLAVVLGAIAVGPLLDWRALRRIAQLVPPLFVLMAVLVLVTGNGYYYGDSSRFGVPMFGSPNTTAFVTTLSIALTLYALTRAKPQATAAQTIWYGSLLVAQLAVLLATESDGGALMACIAVAAFVRRRIPLTVMGLAAVGLVVTASLRDLEVADSDLVGSGRLLIWLELLIQWQSSLLTMLVGVGPGAIDLEPGFTERVASAHSMYIEILFTFGLVGLGLTAAYLVRAGLAIWRRLPYLPQAEGDLLLSVFGLVTVGIAFDSYFLAAQLVWLGVFVHGIFLLARCQIPSGHSSLSPSPSI